MNQDFNRLQYLATAQEAGRVLSPEEEVELNVLWRAWDTLHDPLSSPPEGAGMLLWSGE